MADFTTPPIAGVARVFMQKRGMHGHVTALGRNTPASNARINADRSDVLMRGSFDYAAWKAAKLTPGAGINYDYTVTNLGAYSQGETISETDTRPGAPPADQQAQVYDTQLRPNHAADVSGVPVTARAMAGAVSDGT